MIIETWVNVYMVPYYFKQCLGTDNSSEPDRAHRYRSATPPREPGLHRNYTGLVDNNDHTSALIREGRPRALVDSIPSVRLLHVLA